MIGVNRSSPVNIMRSKIQKSCREGWISIRRSQICNSYAVQWIFNWAREALRWSTQTLSKDWKVAWLRSHSYGWERTLRTHLKMSRRSEHYSILSRTIKHSCPKQSASASARSCHSYSRCYPSEKRWVYKRIRIRSWRSSCMRRIPRITPVRDMPLPSYP